ncbi:efflux RND transporter periplasmic adaptor subunit [Agaribacter flavus]|uniref:Efflux RND transporter periplasmic adaptor subunit n=1 Tax=Agaribacter flavus TaxID=1902781 RepID=A0ABV7FXF8_9ALTE
MIKDTSAQDVEIPSQGISKRKLGIGFAVLLVVAFAANAIITQPKANMSVDRLTVQIAALERGELIRDVSANGRIVAANAPQVYAPEQGFVNLLVKAGDQVQKGQSVAVVDSPELENQLKQQRSELNRLQGELARQELDARRQTLQLTKQMDLASVDLDAAERENRRAQASIVDNLISQIDLEKAVDDLARAKLNFKHAKQEVELAKDTLAFELESARSTVSTQALVVEELERKINELTILASVDGVVGNLLVQPRALVTKNAALMTLVDLSAYEAELDVAESYANELSVGLPVEIRIGNERIIGRLASISPEVTNREVTTRVRFEQEDVPNIRQNQQITGRVLLENKGNVLKVRRGSFMQTGGHVAYKIEDNIASRVEISLGASSMREVEVLSGLNENDQIIISNYEQFEEADTVLLRD